MFFNKKIYKLFFIIETMDSGEHKKEEVSHVEHEHHKHVKHKSNFLKSMRANPWIVSTIVFVILILVLLFSGVPSGHHISEKKVADSLIGFYESQGISGLNISSMSEEHGLYEINLTYKGQGVPFYVTKDGYLAGNALVPLLTNLSSNSPSADSQTQQEVPKADKPKVELFIMAMCPYGTQAEKGILPALNLLKDKVNFTLRFVSYSMHGKDEIDENTRLYCVQKEAPEKLYDYMKCYLGANDPSKWDSCISEVGIEKSKMDSCINSTDKEFNITGLFNDKSTWMNGRYPQYNVDKDLNSRYGVQGSPTFVINGVQSNAGRDSASYLDAICQSFTDGNVPEECGTELSSTSPSPGFGFGESNSGSSGGQCA